MFFLSGQQFRFPVYGNSGVHFFSEEQDHVVGDVAALPEVFYVHTDHELIPIAELFEVDFSEKCCQIQFRVIVYLIWREKKPAEHCGDAVRGHEFSFPQVESRCTARGDCIRLQVKVNDVLYTALPMSLLAPDTMSTWTPTHRDTTC